MLVASIDVGKRRRPAVITPSRVVSVGYSSAGTVQQHDFGLQNQLVDISLPYVADATRVQLQQYLDETQKPGGIIAMTPDSGDDFGIVVGGVSISGETNFYYVPGSFRATLVKPGYWDIQFTARYLA